MVACEQAHALEAHRHPGDVAAQRCSYGDFCSCWEDPFWIDRLHGFVPIPPPNAGFPPSASERLRDAYCTALSCRSVPIATKRLGDLETRSAFLQVNGHRAMRTIPI